MPTHGERYLNLGGKPIVRVNSTDLSIADETSFSVHAHSLPRLNSVAVYTPYLHANIYAVLGSLPTIPSLPGGYGAISVSPRQYSGCGIFQQYNIFIERLGSFRLSHPFLFASLSITYSASFRNLLCFTSLSIIHISTHMLSKVFIGKNYDSRVTSPHIMAISLYVHKRLCLPFSRNNGSRTARNCPPFASPVNLTPSFLLHTARSNNIMVL